MIYLSKHYLIISLLCLTCYFSFSQTEQRLNYDLEILIHLVHEDKIYEAVALLDNQIAEAKINKDTETIADSYFKLGSMFSHIESYPTAINHYNKAFQLYDSLKQPRQIDKVIAALAKTYSQNKSYSKFDSIIPIALGISEKLHSTTYFLNLESQARKLYYQQNFQDCVEIADLGLTALEDFHYAYENVLDQSENERLLIAYQYFKAVSLINLKRIDEGFDLAFKINTDAFKTNTNKQLLPYSYISTLNYYKYVYYNKYDKQPDSAIKYLRISDNYKYSAIKDLQYRISKNGELISKIVNTERELELTNALLKKDEKIAFIFSMTTLVLSLLLIVSAGSLYYYYSNRKAIAQANAKLKAYNKRLLAIDKERLEFFSVLSHELRTPIYGISGLAKLIKEEPCSDLRKKHLKSLISSSNYISVLIDNVLQVSKLKFENKVLKLEPTNIAQLIANVSNSVRLSAEQKNLDLIINIDKLNKKECVLLDKVALSQVLINLTYNAIRYTHRGFVAISVSEQKRKNNRVSYLFEVTDSGIGIAQENNEIIFNAYENKAFLKKNSTGSGLGLGLYIAKTLLKSYNSEIHFISTINEGSNFYFEIDFECCEILEEDAPKVSATLGLNRVLAVDDNSINLMITKKNVERIPGYTCHTVDRGVEAVELIKSQEFDLILMDINMPEMDGYEATRLIREFNPTIPIIALTALNSGEVAERAQNSGMNHVITKPFDFDNFEFIILSYTTVLHD